MQMFIAPNPYAYKTVTPAVARQLVKGYDAFVKSDGRIECGPGYITCELPSLNATEKGIAAHMQGIMQTIESRSKAIEIARARAVLDDSHLTVAELEELRSESWKRLITIREMVTTITADPLRVAAIFYAASQTN